MIVSFSPTVHFHFETDLIAAGQDARNQAARLVTIAAAVRRPFTVQCHVGGTGDSLIPYARVHTHRLDLRAATCIGAGHRSDQKLPSDPRPIAGLFRRRARFVCVSVWSGDLLEFDTRR